MKILKLKISNFKGIKNRVIDFSGYNYNIYGENKSGKTRIADSWSWLLFGKDTHDKTDFEIRNINCNGDITHNVESEVEALIDIEGTQYTFKKVYSEKYTTKRNNAEILFDGSTITHYIDDNFKKQREYKDAIKNIIPEDTFKMLSNPLYFNNNNQVDWKLRRITIFKLANNIRTDYELASEMAAGVFADEMGFSEIVKVLKNHTIDEYKKIVARKKLEVNKEIKNIPVRIDELYREQPEGDKESVLKAIERYTKQIEKLQHSKIGVEKVKMQTQISKLRQSKLNEEQKNIVKINVLESARKHSYDFSTENNVQELNLITYNKNLKEVSDSLDKLRVKKVLVDKICPTCGHAIDEEKVVVALRKLNFEKAEKIGRLVSQMSGLVHSIDKTKVLIEKNSIELNNIHKFNEGIDNQIKTIKNTVFDEDIKIKTILKKIDILNVSTLKSVNSQRVVVLKDKVFNEHKKLADIESFERSITRINELKDKEKRLAIEFTKIVRDEILSNKFTSYKSNLLEQEVNSKFKMVKFKLFNKLVNGGIEETCITTVNGVSWSGLSGAEKIHAGMDIIKTLQKLYNITIPLFIDNRESITSLPSMDGTQIINLIVSKKDKEVRLARLSK